MIGKKLSITIDDKVVFNGTIASIEHGGEMMDGEFIEDELEVVVEDDNGEGPFLVQFPTTNLK